MVSSSSSLTGRQATITFHGETFTTEVLSTIYWFDRVDAVEVRVPRWGNLVLSLTGHPDCTVEVA